MKVGSPLPAGSWGINSRKLVIVAEGVEDRDEYDYLRDHGCDAVQGYFISGPVPAAALTTWLQDRAPVVRAR